MTAPGGLADSWVIARRSLKHIRRQPEMLTDATIQPIMFVLLFAYVFGSAIPIQGVNYREFLMAGIFAQTVVFGSTLTGYYLAEDLQKGIIDRFRSLPMSQSAVLVGRTSADVATNVLVLAVMSLTGLIVGWRIRTSFFEALAAYLLLLVFAYAFSWIMAYVGLAVRAPEVVNNASFIVILPLTFIANTFVPIDNFPPVLKWIAEWNPVSSVTLAARQLFGNLGAHPIGQTAWSLQHPALYTVLWAAGILLLFIPLAVRQFKQAAAR